MNYTELKSNVEDICENTFTDAQHAMFTQQAEQKIYNTVDLPALRRNVTASTAQNVPYVATPSDFLYVYSLAVVDDAGTFSMMLNKDVNFIREAYPSVNVAGVPKHYAIFDADSFILGPTPDAVYQLELHYGYYPESIVTAGTTWLGQEFDSALLNGALVEAIRFLKGEPDTVAFYEKLYVQSMKLLQGLSDDRLRKDMYRSGQKRNITKG